MYIDKLRHIAHLIATQYNHYTRDPVFIVQKKVRDYGYDPNYVEDTVVWLDDDNCEASDEKFTKLEEVYFDNGDEPDNWTRTAYVDRWEFVTLFFTEEGAQEYISMYAQRHDLELRIDVDSAYCNPELQALRNHLGSLLRELDDVTAERDDLKSQLSAGTVTDGKLD